MPTRQEALEQILTSIGVGITKAQPSADCTYHTKGFCREECYALSILLNQVRPGMAFAGSAKRVTSDAMATGCTLFERAIPPESPGL